MRHFLLLILFFNLSGGQLFGQKLNKYWLEFSDKKDAPFSLNRPGEFLSPRSLERRAVAGILLDETDLPVNPGYINSLKFNGLTVHCTSRWLNGAAIIADSTKVSLMRKLPFVKSVEYVGPHLKTRNPPVRKIRQRASAKPEEITPVVFGYATRQLALMNEIYLHFLGKTGQGKMVAVMDGGFINVDTLPFFDSVFYQNRLFQGRDFVENDGSVYEQSSHGTAVLSVMAANVPGWFMGAAPSATYVCSKTEDTGGEFPIEEINWIAGAEFADSIGADVLNASLGYTTFNDNSLSHNYLTLNGRTAIGSRGAAIAAKKGMLICNSAGNEGDGDWHFIGVPADAPGVVAVGAVTYEAVKADFSSFGPTADGRIKPDLAAPGQQIVSASIRGLELTLQNGTSLASPLLAGSLAALWSAFPEKTGAEILAAVFQSADQFQKPDNALGWGLPDFWKAWLILSAFNLESVENGREFLTKMDDQFLKIQAIRPLESTEHLLEIQNLFGEKTGAAAALFSEEMLPESVVELEQNLPRGVHFLQLISDNEVHNTFIVRQ